VLIFIASEISAALLGTGSGGTWIVTESAVRAHLGTVTVPSICGGVLYLAKTVCLRVGWEIEEETTM